MEFSVTDCQIEVILDLTFPKIVFVIATVYLFYYICSGLLPPLPGISVGSRHILIMLMALIGGFL